MTSVTSSLASHNAAARSGPASRTALPSAIVVDDDPLFRTLCRGCLSQHYDVRVAADGHEALKLALEQPPQLVLLDLVMPGWDGLRTLRAIASEPSLDQTQVLVLTAEDAPEVCDRVSDAGAAGMLSKTQFSRDALLNAIDAMSPTARGPRHVVRRVEPVLN